MQRNKEEHSFDQMIENLKIVPDEIFANYQLAHDHLHRKITHEQFAHLVEDAIQCGITLSEEVQGHHFHLTLYQIIDCYGLKIKDRFHPDEDSPDYLSLYDPEGEISIMTQPIDELLRVQVNPRLSSVIIRNLILGRELFHHLEHLSPKIYTTSTRLTVWKLFNHEHKAKIKALSDIAAASFSRHINGGGFSPFVPDVLLKYLHNPRVGKRVYRELTADVMVSKDFHTEKSQ